MAGRPYDEELRRLGNAADVARADAQNALAERLAIGTPVARREELVAEYAAKLAEFAVALGGALRRLQQSRP